LTEQTELGLVGFHKRSKLRLIKKLENWSFSKLKLIKNYLRSTMGQSRLSDLALLSIESDMVKDIDFDDVIDRFAALKTIRETFK